MPEIRYTFVASGQESIDGAFVSITGSGRRAERAMKAFGIAAERAGEQASDALSTAGRSASQVGAAPMGPYRTRARAMVSAEEAAQRDVKRLRERGQKDEDRIHQRRLRVQMAAEKEGDRLAAQRGAKRGKEEAQAQIRAMKHGWAGSAKSLGGDAIRGVGSAVKGIGLSALGGGAALATGVTIAAARDAMRLQEASNRISINARQAGQGFVDPDVLRKEFEAVAIATPGVKSADIAEATQGFVTKTGRLDLARRFQGTFATTASATGAKVQDVSNAAADLFQKFDITSIEEMREALAALTAQGKNGAFELADAASKFAKMSSAAQRFGLDKGVKGVKTLGGLSQIAMSATGNADTAASAVEATLRQLIAKAPDLQGAGVNVFDESGKTRDVTAILTDAIAKVGGNDMAAKTIGLQKIFGDEGIRALSPLLAAYSTAFQGATGAGGKKATDKERATAGRAAVTREFKTAIDAPGSWSDIQKDAGQAQTDASAKMNASWEKISAVAAEKVLPVMTRFAEAIADTPELIEAFSLGLDGLLNMLQTLGILRRKSAPTPREQQEEAQRKAKEAQATLDRLPSYENATPEQRTQIVEAVATRNIAGEDVKRHGAAVARLQGVRSAQQIQEQYLSLGKQESDPVMEQRRVERARRIGEDIAKGGMSVSPLDLSGETEAQKQARTSQMVIQKEARVAVGGTAEGNGSEMALGGLAAEVEKLKTALGLAGGAAHKLAEKAQASIIGPG